MGSQNPNAQGIPAASGRLKAPHCALRSQAFRGVPRALCIRQLLMVLIITEH